MADYVVKEESLAGIADAIREKCGSSELFEFPDGFVEAIAGITGSINGVSKFSSGTYTAASQSTASVRVYHLLGEMPDIVLVIAREALPASSSAFYFELITTLHVSTGTTSKHSISFRGTSSSADQGASNLSESVTSTQFYFNKAGYTLPSGSSYLWLALKFD